MRLAILTLNWKLPKNRRYARREFCRALTKLGFEVDPESIEVRSPLQNKYTFEHPSATKWHKDGLCGKHGIIWSDRYPTLLRERRSKRQIELPAGAIVLFDNDYYRHRPDPKGKNHRRWFIRYDAWASKLPKRTKHPIWIISNSKTS